MILKRAITGQWRYVTASAVLAAGHNAGEALVPVLIGRVIDEAIPTGQAGALFQWLLILAVVFAGLSTCYRFGARAGERASEQAAHQVRIDVTRRVLSPMGGAAAGRLSGELASIATADAQRVGAVNMALPAACAAIAGILVSAIALLRVSVPLGLVVLLGAPPLLALAHVLGKPLERRSHVEQERAAHASGVAADLVAGLRVLKGIGAEQAAVARYRQTSQHSLGATLRAARVRAWHDGVILALTGVFIAVVALVGGRLAVRGDISVGDLVAAVGLALFLLSPLSIFTWVNAELAQARSSAARVASVLAVPAAVSAGVEPLPGPVQGRIRLRGLCHGTLRDVDLDVAPGELLGVVAADPADATALLACLGRDVDPVAGSIELDGVPLRGLDPTAVRTVILVAAHDADLFEGRLIDNVTAASAGAGVAAALSAAAADEVAQTLPQGVDTMLAERGQSLSGGQRQRVALARALAADPPVLVVHDPTTAVDAVTEARIAAGIRDLRRGRTTIMMTTSPALLAVTDRVVVIDGGTIAGEGCHRELVRDHERYQAVVLAI